MPGRCVILASDSELDNTDQGMDQSAFVRPRFYGLFVSPPDKNAKDLYEALRDRDIYVRYFAGPRTENYLRITIGTPLQMDRLFGALEDWLREGKREGLKKG